ncbi:hypothetical protein ACLKA6_001655 [Drosophila palustris]
MASWYRRFVPNFATLVQPMTELLKKGRKWSWGEEQEKALCQLKEKLTTAPVLACPDFSARFVLQTDASDYGLGAVLSGWVELVPLKRATAAHLQTAFRERILSSFGVPKKFVCDNGVQFASRNFQVVKFISPNIVRLAREGERKRRVANVMQLKPFYQEEEGEDEELHPQEAGETRPAGSKTVTDQ